MLVTTIVLLSATLSAPLPSDAGREARVAFEKKLTGEWLNGGPCIGDITIRSNGTFERRHYSPGNETVRGTWKLKWDALSPTLLLTCDESDGERHVGKTWDMKVIRLDDEAMHWESGGNSAGRFKRKKE